jgi:hypothetical protein
MKSALLPDEHTIDCRIIGNRTVWAIVSRSPFIGDMDGDTLRCRQFRNRQEKTLISLQDGLQKDLASIIRQRYYSYGHHIATIQLNRQLQRLVLIDLLMAKYPYSESELSRTIGSVIGDYSTHLAEKRTSVDYDEIIEIARRHNYHNYVEGLIPSSLNCTRQAFGKYSQPFEWKLLEASISIYQWVRRIRQYTIINKPVRLTVL